MTRPGRPRRTDGSARRRLRAVGRGLGIAAWTVFCAAGVVAVTAALGHGSPLMAVAVLYGGTVLYGLGEMVKLRERAVFGPLARGPATPWLRWWAPRVVLVLVVAALPALLLLAGLGKT